MKSAPRSTRHTNQRSQRFPNSGQTVLELALITPLLLIMLLGAIEIGRYAYIGILVGNAAHAGALYAAQGLPQSGDSAGVTQAADNDFQNNGQDVSKLQVSPPSVSCGCDNGGTITGDACSTTVNASAGTCPGGGHWVVMVSVTAQGTFNSLFKYPGIPSSVTVSRTSLMPVSQYGN